MKAEELMIGDWVFAYGKKTQIVWVGNIHKMAVRGFPSEFMDGEILPIPLTPEILEKNGFEVDEKNENMLKWRWSVIDDCISYDKSTGMVRIFYPSGLVFVKILKFVHELQHALRLCNIDKEIVL